MNNVTKITVLVCAGLAAYIVHVCAVSLPGGSCERIDAHLNYWDPRKGSLGQAGEPIEAMYGVDIQSAVEKQGWMKDCILADPAKAQRIINASRNLLRKGCQGSSIGGCLDSSESMRYVNVGISNMARALNENAGDIKGILARSNNQTDVDLVIDYLFWGWFTSDPVRRNNLRNNASPELVRAIDRIMNWSF